MSNGFDVDAEIKSIDDFLKKRKKRRLKADQLTKHLGEIAQFRERNVSYAKITLWVGQKCGIRVDRTTVIRFCDTQGIKNGLPNGKNTA